MQPQDEELVEKPAELPSRGHVPLVEGTLGKSLRNTCWGKRSREKARAGTARAGVGINGHQRTSSEARAKPAIASCETVAGVWRCVDHSLGAHWDLRSQIRLSCPVWALPLQAPGALPRTSDAPQGQVLRVLSRRSQRAKLCPARVYPNPSGPRSVLLCVSWRVGQEALSPWLPGPQHHQPGCKGFRAGACCGGLTGCCQH